MSHARIIKGELVSYAELSEPLYIAGWVSQKFGIVLCHHFPPFILCLAWLDLQDSLGFAR